MNYVSRIKNYSYLCGMKHTLLLLLALLLCLPIMAQQQTYRARVVDAETGKAILYAGIKGDSQVAMANAEGVFAIEAQGDQRLTVSAIGYSDLQTTANQMGDTVRLQALKTVTEETKDGTAEAILRKLVKKMAKEYKRHPITKSTYFTRRTSCFEKWMETSEAFQLSESALNIGNTKRAGEKIYRVDEDGYNMRLPYTDLQHLTELGASTVESRFWQYTEKPLRLKLLQQISQYDPFSSGGLSFSGSIYRMYADIDKWNFDYSCEMEKDAQGQDVAKIYVRKKPDFWDPQSIKDAIDKMNEALLTQDKKSRRVKMKEKDKLKKLVDEYDRRRRALLYVRNTYGTEVALRDALEPDAFPIIDGIIWVDTRNNQLMAFQGTLHNFSLSLDYYGAKKKVMAEVFVDITYTHRRKFTEVENLALYVKAGNLTSHTLLCNMYLDEKSDKKRISKMSKKPTEAAQLTGLPHPILRTQEEEHIVAVAEEGEKK